MIKAMVTVNVKTVAGMLQVIPNARRVFLVLQASAGWASVREDLAPQFLDGICVALGAFLLSALVAAVFFRPAGVFRRLAFRRRDYSVTVMYSFALMHSAALVYSVRVIYFSSLLSSASVSVYRHRQATARTARAPTAKIVMSAFKEITRPQSIRTLPFATEPIPKASLFEYPITSKLADEEFEIDVYSDDTGNDHGVDDCSEHKPSAFEHEDSP
ncbi:hypothetical protein B0H67DRAFT_638256 [Lasiosphaeris hirsuta]|uniref:Uncharacterized protein n=1 Tax=Lasiosphaeris hirsuta TaxID=260670 RepID=A0AA40E652_9PEZI|nr:hypothetical protein B0H67DRAFT_638256 [Lasiosphaeris hirsuta]